MSIVKKLVEQMEGIVEIESRQGEGSIVQIALSIRVDEARHMDPVNEEQDLRSNVSGMRVLLVEDNEINREIVEFMLKDAGVDVVSAN